MKRWIGWVVGALCVLFLILAFIAPGPGAEWKRLPPYPKTVSEPGKYWLDQERFIEIVREGEGWLYREGKEEPPKDPTAAIVIVASSYSESDDVLPETWAIGLEAPDTIVIEGGEEVIRRTHGQVEVTINGVRKVVIKDPSDPSESLADVIRSVPASEVEVLVPEDETKDDSQ